MKAYCFFAIGAAAFCAILTGCMGAPESDGDMQHSISAAWASDHSKTVAAPDISVSNRIVNLTGMLDSEQDRIDAVRAAWQPVGVIEVVNELQVPDPLTKASQRDRALAIKLRTRLIFDTDVASTHYSIEAMDGAIYLMGIARDAAELARVQLLAEETAGSGEVISYVKVRPTILEN